MDPTLTIAAATIAPVLSLGALWLRLRSRLHTLRARHGALVSLARTLPHGSRVEASDADGTHTHMRIGPHPQDAM